MSNNHSKSTVLSPWENPGTNHSDIRWFKLELRGAYGASGHILIADPLSDSHGQAFENVFTRVQNGNVLNQLILKEAIKPMTQFNPRQTNTLFVDFEYDAMNDDQVRGLTAIYFDDQDPHQVDEIFIEGDEHETEADLRNLFRNFVNKLEFFSRIEPTDKEITPHA